jgi:hypothetical protein
LASRIWNLESYQEYKTRVLFRELMQWKYMMSRKGFFIKKVVSHCNSNKIQWSISDMSPNELMLKDFLSHIYLFLTNLLIIVHTCVIVKYQLGRFKSMQNEAGIINSYCSFCSLICCHKEVSLKFWHSTMKYHDNLFMFKLWMSKAFPIIECNTHMVVVCRFSIFYVLYKHTHSRPPPKNYCCICC